MNKKIGYYSELNAVRAAAVILTLLAHYLTRIGFEAPYFWLGVDVFFVLSGFLITGILLRTKPVFGKKRLSSIKDFFVRRLLRLFPAYYFLIILFWAALNFGHLFIWNNNYNPYFFFYAPNWFFFIHPEQASGSFNHMWSLGVEEQFYLIWPWIILYLPIKYIRNFLFTIIVLSITLRFSFLGLKNFTMLPFTNFHTLGSGSLLAYYFFIKPDNVIFKWVEKRRQILFVISFFLLVIILAFLNLSITKSIFSDLLVASTASLLVLCSAEGWSRPVKFITTNSLVQYIGKISYGIYLYHMPLPDTILAIGKFAGYKINFTDHPILWLSAFFIMAFFIAHFSYHIIEKPFLKMKSMFST